MPVQLICPSLKCRKFLSVPDDFRGKVVRCQFCQSTLRVPTAKKQQAAVTPASAPADAPQRAAG